MLGRNIRIFKKYRALNLSKNIYWSKRPLKEKNWGLSRGGEGKVHGVEGESEEHLSTYRDLAATSVQGRDPVSSLYIHSRYDASQECS